MDLLTAQLDEYNKHGVPKLANVHLQCDVTINEEGTILTSALRFPFSLPLNVPLNERLEILRIPDGSGSNQRKHVLVPRKTSSWKNV